MDTLQKRDYRNDWWLKDLSDISKSILNIGKQYRFNIYTAKSDGRRRMNATMLTQLFYSLYLTGARVGEFLKKPPLFRQFQDEDYTWVHVEKLNEKHFTEYEQSGTTATGRPVFSHKPGAQNKVMPQNIPIDTEAEREMWDFIFEGNQYGTERKMDFSPICPYEKRTTITAAFKSSFKADLTDGEHIYRQAGIVPHMLRHLRVYNMKFNKGYDDSLVQSYLGWSSREMIEHYTYILRQIKDEEQIRQVKKYLAPRIQPAPKLTDIFAEAQSQPSL